MSNQFENERYLMGPSAAQQIKILRIDSGFYQRRLDMKKVNDIKEDLLRKGYSDYPEITVANVNGELQCVDGQHRLIAHILAGMPVPVHIMSMTQEQAIVLFCRDNGKAKPLMRRDLIASSLCPAAKTIRSLSADFKVSYQQVTQIFVGLKGGNTIGDLHDSATGFTDPEIKAASVILETWTNDKRFTSVDAPSALPKMQRETEKAGFSAGITLWCLGKIVRENIANLSKAKRDLAIIREADWSKHSGNSLRKLATSGSKFRRNLLETMKADVLLPAYKS